MDTGSVQQFSSPGPSSAASSLLHQYDAVSGCSCPSCLLAYFMNTVIYGTQKLASAEVMAEEPSPVYRGGLSPPSYAASVGAPARQAPAFPPAPKLTSCPLFDAFQFCMYGRTCLLPHRVTPAGPLYVGPRDLDAAVEDLCKMGQRHMDSDVWSCDVCGFCGIEEAHSTKVGETSVYRYCPNCTMTCYMPQLMSVIERLIDAVGDDYQLYKTKVEEYRRQVPDLLKIPLSYEAHRIATTVFAWSLVGPEDAKLALDVALLHHPELELVVSLGAGTGYVEHVFNRVANGCGAAPHAPLINEGRSSFDGVLCEGLVRRRGGDVTRRLLSFFAFDEIVRPAHYSVTVNFGAPHVLRSIRCPHAILLLSWPPFGSAEEEQSSMGYETLRHYTLCGGRVVIYIGDVSSTGDWRFHGYLMQHYRLAKEYYVRKELRRWSPQEMGLVYAGSDSIGVYLRR